MAHLAALYLITIALLPEKGQDVPKVFANIARILTDTNDVRFVYRFKITGEPTAIVVAEVSKAVALDRLLGKLHRLGKLAVDSQPIITYEEFARNLGVAEELTRHPGKILEKDDLFLVKFTVDYYRNTTDELLAAWKRSAESVLPQILNGDVNLQMYKHVAERSLIHFLNTNNTVRYDRLVFGFPSVQAFGSNIHTNSRGLQFLEEYVADVSDDSGY